MRFMGSGHGGTSEWIFQRISGLVLFFILLLHFILIHYTGEGPITYSKVAYRLSNPYYKAWELMFLILGLYHSMNGIKILINDYIHKKNWKIVLLGVNWITILFFFLFGTITILTFDYQI